jgi:toxin ParE1/3/4
MRLLLSASARRDIADALRQSDRHWGSEQREKYRWLIENALTELLEHPQHPASRARDEVRPGIRTLHIGRRGRPARHFVVYRATPDGDIQVVRLLRDATELSKALSREP